MRKGKTAAAVTRHSVAFGQMGGTGGIAQKKKKKERKNLPAGQVGNAEEFCYYTIFSVM